MVDIFPFGVAFDWDKDGEPTSVVLFERNCPTPSAKVLTFHRCAVSLICEIAFASYLISGLGCALRERNCPIPSAKLLTLHRRLMCPPSLPCCVSAAYFLAECSHRRVPRMSLTGLALE